MFVAALKMYILCFTAENLMELQIFTVKNNKTSQWLCMMNTCLNNTNNDRFDKLDDCDKVWEKIITLYQSN